MVLESNQVRRYTMEYININHKIYKLVKGNRTDETYRKSFNALTEKTFGFNFEQWYQNGYWKDQYIPYSLLDGDKVISNVSVNLMDIHVFGQSKRFIQLGTVMTDEAYRKQGLIREILHNVLEDWQSKCAGIYLFANASVLDFYPKFGFKKWNQYQCSKIICATSEVKNIQKLNMSDENNRKFLYHKVNAAIPYGEISMERNGELILFYCSSFMKENVYYLPDQDIVVVANYEQDCLEILGIFCEREVSLDWVIDYMATKDTKSVKLHFTPKEVDSYVIRSTDEEDTLFILGEDTMGLTDKQFMFPTLSHT